MNQTHISSPPLLQHIQAKCIELGFDMASDEKAGSLLRVLVTSRPNGRFLELGTGIGASLCWMLDGMNTGSSMISVDNDPRLIKSVDSIFGEDPRLTLICGDGEDWIYSYCGQSFDLVFADSWPGKYFCLEETLALIKPGGFYVVDDMLPQPNWPEGHAEKASSLLGHLAQRKDLVCSMMEWSTGIVVCTKMEVN